MFSNINKYPDWADATIEILIIVFVSFFLWFLLSWLFFYKKTLDNNTKTVTNKKDKSFNIDNLKIIEGIWWKIEKVLNKSKILTFKDLSNTDNEKITTIIEKLWKKDKTLYFKTWPDQARLASNKKWWELKEYQELLLSSKKSK